MSLTHLFREGTLSLKADLPFLASCPLLMSLAEPALLTASSLEQTEPPELSFFSSMSFMSEPDLVWAMLAAMLPGLSQMNTADLQDK